jgi:hypothetical protein
MVRSHAPSANNRNERADARSDGVGSPVAGAMPFSRHTPRITDTRGLSAKLGPPGRRRVRGVLNLSEGGMLVKGNDLAVGAIATFELVGPGFRAMGLAEVAHSAKNVTGLRFLRWDGSGDRPVRNLIRARAQDERMKDPAHSVPGSYLG